MLIIGKILLSYDINNNIIIIDIKKRKLISEIILLQKSQITSIIHPNGYLNKIIIGYNNGELELFNINSKKLIYTFQSLIPYINNKNKLYQDDSDDDNWYNYYSIINK